MWTQCTSVTDRRTDGPTDRITITKTVLRTASHGKNDVTLTGIVCSPRPGNANCSAVNLGYIHTYIVVI